jgi:hypothetical protein
MTIELDEPTAADLFRGAAQAQEALEPDTNCGHCGGERLCLRVRHPPKGEYFEWVCRDCHYRLQMGKNDKGGLWAKRKDKEGNILDHRGWIPPYGSDEG